MSSRLLPRAAFALLFLSLAATSLPRLVTLGRAAAEMSPLPYETRRERQLGDWYRSVARLRRELPPHEPVALIAPPNDLAPAVFANYYLYPIRTRLYAGRNPYRNAAFDPARPRTIVYVDGARAERTTYDTLRDRELRAGRRVVAAPQLSAPATRFVLPIAASLDGPSPETFVIEATLVNDSATPANVRVTFWPNGLSASLSIAPRGTAAYYDFVHQLFNVIDSGWIEVDSSQPLHAAFYFANRGRRDATLLPNVSAPATSLSDGPLFRDNKLFLLNTSDAAATAFVDGTSIALPPHGIVSRAITRVPRVTGNVYAFVTTRELNARTDFLWPR